RRYWQALDQKMDKTCKKVKRLVKQHPEGVPLTDLAVLYSQRYHRNLIVAELGFPSISAFIASLTEDLVVHNGTVFHRKPSSLCQVATKMVKLVKSFPAGVPLNKLAVSFSQRYKRNLTLSELGFSTMAAFIDSLDDKLLVKADVVKTPFIIVQEVVNLVKNHPNGIPLKKLSMFFSQEYKQNLAVSKLGFSSTADFVGSLSADLLVENESVFHKVHRATPGSSASLSKTQPALLSGPRISFGGPTQDEMSLEELLEKVTEVISVHPAARTSLTQLQNSYFLHFGKILPLKLYMSLYDSQTSKQQAPSGRAPVNVKLESTVGIASVSPQSTSLANGDGSKMDSPPRCPQPAATSVLPAVASLEDFPPLGTWLSRADKSSRETQEGGAQVFRESYHAQLREVHRADVRAGEALEEEADDGQESVPRRKKKVVNPDDVNSLAEDAIRSIAAEGELVTHEKVRVSMCTLMQVSSLYAVRIDPRWQLPALKELQRTVKEINLFIHSVEMASSMCTLYELGQAIAGLKNKKRFEELHLGPLCKFPLVHRLFKIDSNTKDDDIHQIETVDILRSLRNFRRKQSKPKVDLAEFMKYLADQYNCESPYELGIRIQSVGLPISTLTKAYSSEKACMDKARDALQKEIEEEVQSKLWKIKKSLLEPAQGLPLYSSAGSLELRKKYAGLTAAEAVMEVFTNSMGVFSERMTKRVQDFLMHISGDRLARTLFQLAICGGSLVIPHDLAPKEKSRKQAADRKSSEEAVVEAPPTEAVVRQYFQECLSAIIGTVSLASLCRLEKKVTEHFCFREFRQLQLGSFLEFLVKDMQFLQEAVGGSVAIGSQDVRACGYRPSQQDVYEFIKQCGEGDPSQLPLVEAALRSQYGLRDCRELGYGPLRTLADFARRQRELCGGGTAACVRYECPLLPKNPGEGLPDTVGLLGELSRDQAVASLLSAPLLQDLSEWSQWALVFQPSHGPLKDFIEKYCGNTDLLALEVSPGVLLRITTLTSDKHFSGAAQALDPVGTAGHLVSIVVAHGIANTPTALLANHMEGALATAVAQEDLTLGEDDCTFSTVAKFLLECITRMPTRICKELLQQVILEPLSKVLGHAKSKSVLLEAARAESRYLSKLHRMGLLLGLTEWVRDFHGQLVPQLRPQLPPGLSSHASKVGTSAPLGLDKHEENDDADEGDDEELFELASELNEEASSIESRGEDEEDEEEEEAVPASECLSQHRAIVEDIRSSEFGIGVELNEEGQNLMKKHQQRLGRSLERLSTELYSKDTHFVLELIQNADDNSYPPGGSELPALAFVVQKDCIAILNNECGFEERNVRAICDVGRSTKGKHTCGYIGQKGIGFKSVFKVTDCPEIHSNGFHIRFDKTSDPMGYILPHWVDEERPVHSVAKEITEKSWTTKILLLLRSECYQTKNLFHDVHPSLLLFLHRLRSITIYSEAERRLVSMTRRDLSHDILEVKHADGVDRWLVVKKVLHSKKIKEGVESTELALAFQLGTGSAGDACTRPAMQPVFAFLPLRSFGFRFIVQGDFDIPSSREDVDRDSPWNQFLRSEIPQLFLQAMDVFSKHPEFSELQGLCHFLQFIPQPSEILDFFSPVANQIIQLLKGKPFLPAKEDPEGSVEFKLPSQVAMCQDPLVQDVIGGAELREHLSLSYLHPALHLALSSSLLSALGVHRLRGADVTTVVCAMARSLAQHGHLHSDSSLKKLAKLLACNFRALDSEYGEVDDLLQSLRDVPIIPLADGRVVALSAEGVFFPLGDGKRTHTGILQALYADLSVVEPRLLACLDELGNSQVRELLRRLQVHELEPEQVLQQHIYPTLKSGVWKAKSKAITVGYLVFIKQHGQERDYLALRTHIPVLTNRGFLCSSQSGVHFSKEYGNIDLPAELPGLDWVLLDTGYLQADQDVEGWRELFSKLGVRDLLIFRKERRTLTASSPWAVEAELWPKPSDGAYVIEDQHCEEFRCLATAEQLSAHDKLRQRQALLRLLERHWDSGERYVQYRRAQVLDSQGRPRDCSSSFYHQLTRLAWVPAHRPTREGARSVDYLCPSAVYLLCDDLYRLLGSHVHYVDMAPSEFSRAAGMRHSMGVDEMVEYLKRWCTRQPDGEGDGEVVGAEFTTTVGHIHAMYCYLQAECSSTQLRELFQHFPAIFIEYDRTDEWCSGRFYHLKDVCWSDSTGMFVRYKDLIRRPDSGIQEPKVLAPFYNNLENIKDLFRWLNVEPGPSMRQYVDLLEAVCESAALPTGEVLQDISVIFARLGECVVTHREQDQDVELNQHYCKSLKEMVTGKKVFPTKTLGWVTLARQPMVADSPNLEKIFKSHSEVCLLSLPQAQRKDANRLKQSGRKGNSLTDEERMTFSEQDRELFLDICGVKRLSQCVTTEALTESYRPCPPMQALVRDVIPYLQRFMYHHEDLGELYRDLKDAGIAQEIRSLSFGQVGKLYIYYRLEQPEEQPIVESDDIICLLKDRKHLYIQKDHLLPKLDICRELVNLFTTEKNFVKELEHFLEGLVVCINDKAGLKRFLDRKGVQELPTDEEPWEVPVPVEVKLEPVAMHLTLVRCLPLCVSPPSDLAREGAGSQAVEAVMKMWPPPAPPASGPSAAPPVQRDRRGERSSSSVGKQERPGELHLHGEAGALHVQGPRPSSTPHPAVHEALQPTEVVASQFQGSGAQRSGMPLSNAVWTKPMATEAVLEDLALDGALPLCPPLPVDYDDTAAIGMWGEQLVYSFLGRWRDVSGGPRDVTWYNQGGESGQPCDFKLTFADDSGAVRDVFVEVKTTVKHERHYIRLSANELDFALKEKGRYHIYRVYGAGDPQSVRLCRIRNLAQHLHAKTLELFLFV
uniref:HTH OST-type domain-containing protein n=1 Tax=Electrophorus electricus TaxID=8005 RepID=A0A4W4ERA0_ELEEL